MMTPPAFANGIGGRLQSRWRGLAMVAFLSTWSLISYMFIQFGFLPNPVANIVISDTAFLVVTWIAGVYLLLLQRFFLSGLCVCIAAYFAYALVVLSRFASDALAFVCIVLVAITVHFLVVMSAFRALEHVSYQPEGAAKRRITHLPPVAFTCKDSLKSTAKLLLFGFVVYLLLFAPGFPI